MYLHCWKQPFEFSLNDFHWIQWTQWIASKSKNGMVTRNSTQRATCTLPVAVIKISFLSQASVRYLLPFTQVNSYLTRCSWENLQFATTSGNISVISCGVSRAVTIPLLDLLVFHLGKTPLFQHLQNIPGVQASGIVHILSYLLEKFTDLQSLFSLNKPSGTRIV